MLNSLKYKLLPTILKLKWKSSQKKIRIKTLQLSKPQLTSNLLPDYNKVRHRARDKMD